MSYVLPTFVIYSYFIFVIWLIERILETRLTKNNNNLKWFLFSHPISSTHRKLTPFQFREQKEFEKEDGTVWKLVHIHLSIEWIEENFQSSDWWELLTEKEFDVWKWIQSVLNWKKNAIQCCLCGFTLCPSKLRIIINSEMLHAPCGLLHKIYEIWIVIFC